jgi:predicted Zn-dependent protease
MAQPSQKKNSRASFTSNGRRRDAGSAAATPNAQRRTPIVRTGLWVVIALALAGAVAVRVWELPEVRRSRYQRQTLAALQAAAERRPGDPVLRLALGRKLQAAGRTEEASAEFQRAAALEPKSPDGLTALGEALAAAGRDDEAFQALQMSLARKPTVEALCAQGRLYLGHRVPEKAIPVLQRAVELANKTDPEPWRLMARARAAVGQWSAADRAWSHVGSRAPGDHEALRGRAEALIQLGRPEEAEPHLRHLLARAPRDANAHALLGAALAARQPASKHSAAAEAAFRQALQIDPASREGAYGLALLLLRERRAAEAIPLLQELVRRAPESLRARFQYARSLRAVGRTPEADRALREYHRRAEAERLEMELRGRLTLRPDDPALRARLNRLLRENRAGSQR